MLAVVYGPRAHDMWRWADDGADGQVGEFVSRLDGRDPKEWQTIRAGLSRAGEVALLIFAKRCAFAAIREQDPALVHNALAAMSLITEAGIGDDRVIWTIAGIVHYADRCLNSVTRAQRDVLLTGADTVVVKALEFMSDKDRGLAFDSGLQEATTRAGQVFLNAGQHPYTPKADLVDMAYSVAEILEADAYHVESIAVAERLMLYAFDDDGDHVDATAVAAAARQTAAVYVEAVLSEGPYQPLRAYIVELPDALDAAKVACAADCRDWPDETQIAVAAGPVCAVLRIDYRDKNEPFVETVERLHRFRVNLLTAIT